jgi:hypothetical protein
VKGTVGCVPWLQETSEGELTRQVAQGIYMGRTQVKRRILSEVLLVWSNRRVGNFVVSHDPKSKTTWVCQVELEVRSDYGFMKTTLFVLVAYIPTSVSP